MKRISLIILAFLLALNGALFAEGFSIGASAGLYIPLENYRIQDGTTEKNDNYVDMLGNGTWKADLSFGYEVNSLFETGISTSFVMHDSVFMEDKLFYVPLYIDFYLTPNVRQVKFPLGLSAGGFMQVMGDSISIGPAARLSAGVEIDASRWISVFLRTSMEFIFLFSDGRTDIYHDFTPVSAGMKICF